MNTKQKIIIIIYCIVLVASLIWFPTRWDVGGYGGRYVLDYQKEILQVFVLTLIASALVFAFKTKKD